MCKTDGSDLRFYWCVCVCVCLGTSGLVRDRAADRPELHRVWKPQSEQRRRVQKQNVETKTDRNTNKGNNRKIHFDSSFDFRGERDRLHSAIVRSKTSK